LSRDKEELKGIFPNIQLLQCIHNKTTMSCKKESQCQIMSIWVPIDTIPSPFLLQTLMI